MIGRFSLFCCLVVLTCAGAVLGQSSTASLAGTVIDQKQSVVPNATVTVRNTDTGFTRNLQSDGEGRFNFVNLPIGAYEVTVEAANFAKYVQTGIRLLVNQNAVIEPVLRAGNVQEVVTVTENASLLNTTTAEVTRVLTKSASRNSRSRQIATFTTFCFRFPASAS